MTSFRVGAQKGDRWVIELDPANKTSIQSFLIRGRIGGTEARALQSEGPKSVCGSEIAMSSRNRQTDRRETPLKYILSLNK